MAELGVDVPALFRRIEDVVIKACIAVEPQIYNGLVRATKHKNLCFELYGFDILIDENLRPWLIEVNVSPSLSSSSPMDKEIKAALLSDVFNTIGVIPYDQRKYQKEEESRKVQSFLGLNKKGFAAHRGKSINELLVAERPNDLSDDDIEIILESEEEFYRRGHFERIFPQADNIDHYAGFFEATRYSNLLLWRWLKSHSDFDDKRFKLLSTTSV
jgi:tubulin polyglutamylase TTLL4